MTDQPNYEAYITKLITAIKADKSIVQPWRNYALKSLMEAQAFVRMGRSVSLRSDDELHD